jgi:hypothetical protein
VTLASFGVETLAPAAPRGTFEAVSVGLATMSVLAWILRWPPSRGTVVVFLVLTAFSVGSLVAFGGHVHDDTGENVTVEATDLTVRLNDEIDFPEGGNGSVRTCVGMGTPGDAISVAGTVTFDVPREWERHGSDGRELVLVVTLAHTDETITSSVSRTGQVRTQVFGLLDDDETLSPGDTGTLVLRVRHDGSIVATATRTITVEEGTRTYDC